MKILVLNGPNLNRLGKRQPEVYGKTTLADVEKHVREVAGSLSPDLELEFFQSNHEGELIDKVHEAADAGWPVIINPGGFTHTSVALREAFRHHSYLSPIARGVIAGLGAYGYEAALGYFLQD